MSGSFVETARRTEAELGDEISGCLFEIKVVKGEMLDLEKRISLSGESEGVRLQGLLSMKSGELNGLSDRMVSVSREAWGRFNELARFCECEEDDASLLEPVRVLCKEIDVIAADLLCFSLGH